MPVFNPELARLAGIKSGEARRSFAASLKALRNNGHEHPAELLPNPVQEAVQRQLRLIAEQTTHTRAVLNDTSYRYCEHCERGGIEPHHRAQLLKALDTLLERERILRMIPAPAPLRQSTTRQPRRPYTTQPQVEPVAEPVSEAAQSPTPAQSERTPSTLSTTSVDAASGTAPQA